MTSVGDAKCAHHAAKLMVYNGRLLTIIHRHIPSGSELLIAAGIGCDLHHLGHRMQWISSCSEPRPQNGWCTIANRLPSYTEHLGLGGSDTGETLSSVPNSGPPKRCLRWLRTCMHLMPQDGCCTVADH